MTVYMILIITLCNNWSTTAHHSIMLQYLYTLAKFTAEQFSAGSSTLLKMYNLDETGTHALYSLSIAHIYFIFSQNSKCFKCRDYGHLKLYSFVTSMWFYSFFIFINAAVVLIILILQRSVLIFIFFYFHCFIRAHISNILVVMVCWKEFIL